MGSNKPFGGVGVITVGGLFQLLSVQDGYIFEDLKKEHGPLATNFWNAHFSMYDLRLLTHVGFFQPNSLILSEFFLYMERSKNLEKNIS